MIERKRTCLFLCLLVFNVHSEIIPLTSNNFSQYLQEHITFVKFYTHWCPHSKRLKSTWDLFAESKQDNNLRIAEVDCTKDTLLCSEHDVYGYPTLKLFVHGSGARFEGPRQIDSLEAFYREKLAEGGNFEDSVVTRHTVVELTNANFAQMTTQDFAFVVFFAPWCQHCKVLLPVFQQLAKEMITTNGLIFGTVDCTVEEALCKKYSIRGYPTLIWFEKGVEKDQYQQTREVHAMRDYVEYKINEARPTLPVTPSPIEEAPHVEQPVIVDSAKIDLVLNPKTFTQGVSFEGYAFINFGAPWCSHCQKLAPVWSRLAQRFARNEEIRIARVDCTESEVLCRDHGVRAFPTLILFRYGESKVDYNGMRDFESLYNFLVTQLEIHGDEYLLKDSIKND